MAIRIRFPVLGSGVGQRPGVFALVVVLLASSCGGGDGGATGQCAPYCSKVVSLCEPVNGMTQASCLQECELLVAGSTSASVGATFQCVSAAGDCGAAMGCRSLLVWEAGGVGDVVSDADSASSGSGASVPDVVPPAEIAPVPDVAAPDALADGSQRSREIRFLLDGPPPLYVAAGARATIRLEVVDLGSQAGVGGVSVTLRLDADDGGDGQLETATALTDGTGRAQVRFQAGTTTPAEYRLQASAPLADPVELSIEVD